MNYQIKKNGYDVTAIYKCPKCASGVVLNKECSNAECSHVLLDSDRCPSCKKYACIKEQGIIKERIGSRGLFFGCSHYRMCKYTVAMCNDLICNGLQKYICDGLIKRQLNRAICNACNKEYSYICPRCDVGILIKRHTKNGDRVFFPCHFSECDYIAAQCNNAIDNKKCNGFIGIYEPDKAACVLCNKYYEVCSNCNGGIIIERPWYSKEGLFLGCHRHPQCKNRKSINFKEVAYAEQCKI